MIVFSLTEGHQRWQLRRHSGRAGMYFYDTPLTTRARRWLAAQRINREALLAAWWAGICLVCTLVAVILCKLSG